MLDSNHDAAQPPLPSLTDIDPDKWTFALILKALEQLAAGETADITDIEGTKNKLLDMLTTKVDSCRYQTDKWRLEAKQLREYAAEFSAAARSLDGEADRLEGYIAYNMQRHGWDQLRGQKFVVTVKMSERTDVGDDPTPSDYIRYGSDFVRNKFAWDKDALKKALKAGTLPPALATQVKIERHANVNFAPNKETKK